MSGILVLGIVGFVVFILLSWWISTYNFFRSTKEAVATQWSNIITEYERRVDLFLNLAQTVKSFKKYEKETLVQVTKMRKGHFGKTKGDQLKNLGLMESMLSGLNINVEAYPELKANEQHNTLMEEITITEDRINSARVGYNTVVREYNSYLVTFPSNIVANKYNFEKEEYYNTDRKDVSGKAPEVKL